MPWNPDIYNQFKDTRYRPFYDLLQLINGEDVKQAVDVGCGTGEQTAILAGRISGANFLGIDASAEMLAVSKHYENGRVRFEQTTIETFTDAASTWDLIFSNAALQWSDDHRSLFPKLIAKLNPGGQFAVQMPCQKDNVLNMLLHDMVSEHRFAEMVNGFVRHSPVLSMDDYATILFKGGLTKITLFVKVYPIIAADAIELYNFISGSALIPYMERLDIEKQTIFSNEFLSRIEQHFETFPAMYAFKRILMYGVKM